MSDMRLEIGRQVDDVDGIERAFLGTDTASNAEGFRNESDLRFRGYFDTKTTTSHDRAGLLAFLSTFLKGTELARDLRGEIMRSYLWFTLQSRAILSVIIYSFGGVFIGGAMLNIEIVAPCHC
jgi:hypothetical protein